MLRTCRSGNHSGGDPTFQFRSIANDKPVTDQESSRFKEPKIQLAEESDYRARLAEYFDASVGTTTEKLENFAKYVPRQALTPFLNRYEMFNRILNVQGSIVECGVLFGGGLMTWRSSARSSSR